MQRILSGIAFPFQVKNKGFPASAKGTDVVKNAIIVLFRTNQGNRVMRPTLGTRLVSLIFENSGPVLESLIIREIVSAISNELPMVEVVDVDSQIQDKRISVNVRYIVQGVQDETGLFAIGPEVE